MKLWIDDIRTPPDDTWHICRTVLSAIRALHAFKGNVTHINLDHDISHQIVMGGMSRPYACDETFEAVAFYIKELVKHDAEWRPEVRIHTSNPVGAQRMAALFDDVKLPYKIELARGANRLETIL